MSPDYPFLAKIVANLADDQAKLVYADWLEEQGDQRCEFVRKFVAAAQSMQAAEFPSPKGLAEDWLELIGYRLLLRVAKSGHAELKDVVLRLARPALRMGKVKAKDAKIPVGSSKIGGLPDLPDGFAWPPGGDCHAIYNDDTGGTERLAGFMAQVNCAELVGTQAGALLPDTGLLSFFCFQDIENDNPDAIGAKAIHFKDVSKLVRTEPPDELTEGNDTKPAHRLQFTEILDLPYGSEYTTPERGPWGTEIAPVAAAYGQVYDDIYRENMENMLGYGRATSGDDPTPSIDSRHLILLDNAAGCRLHIQIPAKELAARNFDAITLNWVDFD